MKSSKHIPFDADVEAQLNAEWLTPVELEERERIRVRSAQIRSTYPAGTPSVGRPIATVPVPILSVEAKSVPASEPKTSSLPSPLPTAGTLFSSLTFINPTTVTPAVPNTATPSLQRSGRSTIVQFS